MQSFCMQSRPPPVLFSHLSHQLHHTHLQYPLQHPLTQSELLPKRSHHHTTVRGTQGQCGQLHFLQPGSINPPGSISNFLNWYRVDLDGLGDWMRLFALVGCSDWEARLLMAIAAAASLSSA
ncbi:hypothetical protein M405DRAFT_83678 [Rhizopogon salebrosus TDB-379]|nr:hypothetical protein M405DRAFT_83678 [Rhizopogon salebrosus TDB-379]